VKHPTHLRNLISDVSILLLSSARNTHVSLPYCRAGFEMMLCNLNFISVLMFFPKYLLMHPFNLLYFCTLSSRSILILFFDVLHPKYINELVSAG
jgi:hypothetical protein